MTFRTAVQTFVAFVLSALFPASAWGDIYDKAFEDAPAESTENLAWTCSVRDRLDASTVPLVFSISKDGSREFELTLRSRYVLRFALGRADSQGLPAGESGDFVTLRMSDRRDSAGGRVSFQGVHVMNPCDPAEGTFRTVAEHPGFEVQCIPERGFAAYFGGMNTECPAEVDPVVRHYEMVRRGMADDVGGLARANADADENGIARRALASPAGVSGAGHSGATSFTAN